MSLHQDLVEAAEKARTEPNLTVERLALWISDAVYRSVQILLSVDFAAAFIGSNGLFAATPDALAEAVIGHFRIEEML